MSGRFRLALLAIAFSLTAQAAPSTSTLTLQSTQYVSRFQPFYRDGASAQNNSMAVDIKEASSQSHGLRAAANFHDEYSANENWNYFDVSELYASARVPHAGEVSVGRRLETWTAWESNWGQGVFQPRYLENKLSPRAAGLTGAFWHGESTNDSLTVALAAANIPEFGPHYDILGDRIVSANPWFRTPASQFLFQGEPSDIRYSIHRPTNESIVNHPGIAAKWEHRSGDFMNRFSYAYKPIPQLLVSFPTREKYHPSADFMSVEISPRTLYHQVWNWDQSAKLGAWNTSVSVAYEKPADDPGPDGWMAQQVEPAWIYSLSASRPLEEEGPSAARINFSFLKVIGGDAPDRGEFAGRLTQFERRYQYQEAYMIELSKPVRGWFQHPLETGVRAIYDRLQNGGVLALTSSLAFDRNWSAGLQVAWLGLLGSRAAVEDGFFSTYRANDSVAVGATYVF